MIGATNLGKRFGSRWLFRGLNFDVASGQRLVIVGRNGAGKSTLLKILAGLIAPSEGKTLWRFDDYRTDLGYAALEMALYPHLSPIEHLRLAAKLRGCDAREDSLLSRFGLEPLSRQPAIQLSTGQKVRLKLALAVQPHPGVLMLDEPGASLDSEGRQMVRDLCEEQTARGCLIIATNSEEERALATDEVQLGE